MIIYKEKIVKVPDKYKCDKCSKEFDVAIDWSESQEFHHINFIGGWGSIFGDGEEVKCNLCQYCLKELIGDYLQIEKFNGRY
jgi:hypothetical protein